MSKLKRFDMYRNFEPFARMIRRLPAEVLLKVLERESTMIVEDFQKRHVPLSNEGQSIISFHQFVCLARVNEAMLQALSVPLEHVLLYKETIFRLIRIHELPETAMELFERTFSAAA